MPENDVVLLDSLAAKTKPQLGPGVDESASFELFVFDHLLKDYDLSFEELLGGQVDGGNDGGIDGFYTFLNDALLTEPVEEGAVPRHPTMTLHIVSVKHGDTFRQGPLTSLLATLPELLSLQRAGDDLADTYNPALLRARHIFRESYINLATSHPSLNVVITYACRGTGSVPPNVSSRAVELRVRIENLFSQATVEIGILGATELLQIARRHRSYSLRLRFIENYVSRGETNYVLLSRLDDYYRFVTDNDGHLRRYLFEANVRDYLGEGSVNREIRETLSRESSPTEIDFWWLNNGVTVLSSEATVAGKELSLENVQIVNGLQTTESIYRHMKSQPNAVDNRAVLIKVIVTASEDARDRIIRATNYQSAVETASLRATDKIQRDIEHLFGDHGWFYDRRKNYYKNQGRPADRIVSVSYLGATVQALVLKRPADANEQRTRYMRHENQYREVFNDAWDLNVFLVCLELVKLCETLLASEIDRDGIAIAGRLGELKFLVAVVFAVASLKSVTYTAADLLSLKSQRPTIIQVAAIVRRISSEYEYFRRRQGILRRYFAAHHIAGSAEFASWFLQMQDLTDIL